MADSQDATLPAYRYDDNKPKPGMFQILLTLPDFKVKTRGFIDRKTEADGSDVDISFTERSVSATISIPKEKKNYRFALTKLPEDIEVAPASGYEVEKGKIKIYLKKVKEFNSWTDYTADMLPSVD